MPCIGLDWACLVRSKRKMGALKCGTAVVSHTARLDVALLGGSTTDSGTEVRGLDTTG